MADDYEDYEEEEKPAPKPKKRRKPIDWPLLIMLVGTAVFLLIFGAITLMAPRRPFLLVRVGQSARPAPTAAAGAAPAASPAATPAASPAAATPPAKA